VRKGSAAIGEKVKKFVTEFERETGRAPTKCEICRKFGVSWKFVELAMTFTTARKLS